MPSADLRRAIALLKSGEYTCVLAKGERIYTSRERGVAPMLGYLAEHLNLQGFAVADRIVGRAAAMLFVLAGIEEAYGEVMSRRGGISPAAGHRCQFWRGDRAHHQSCGQRLLPYGGGCGRD